ncbi:MAG: GDSL-type esterase/lipase family protein [Ignavibacteriaceae bacterium]
MKKYIFLLLLLGLSAYTFAQTDSLRYKYNPNYNLHLDMYEVYNTRQADIVMLGNSITYGVNWAELLGRNDVVGRGIPSDIVEGFRNRLKYVFNLKPKVCFIMGGINDIYGWIPVDEVFESYVKLIQELQTKNIIVVIQSALYVSSRWPNAENRNPEVEKLNIKLSGYAAKNNLIFMDLNSRLSFRRFLIEDMTYDGVHLTGKAYKIWGREIEKVLKKLGI